MVFILYHTLLSGFCVNLLLQILIFILWIFFSRFDYLAFVIYFYLEACYVDIRGSTAWTQQTCNILLICSGTTIVLVSYVYWTVHHCDS